MDNGEMVDKLLRKRANPNQEPELGRNSAVFTTIGNGNSRMLEKLLMAGAEVNFTSKPKFQDNRFENEWTHLYYATWLATDSEFISLNIMTRLLESGARVNAENRENGSTLR